jgi:predicted double-glycine peptidase
LGYWTQQTVDPDTLYRTYGKGQAQSPEGLAQLYAWEGLYSSSGRDATRAELRQHLDAGRPVVVHGDWTGSGHIVVLVGYTETDWIVNDPAGDWYTCYGCGEADHIHYPLGGAWDDAMSWDGDIWYSVASTTSF